VPLLLLFVIRAAPALACHPVPLLLLLVIPCGS
jgi:hypothetical protein